MKQRVELHPLTLLGVVLTGVVIGVAIAQSWPPSWLSSDEPQRGHNETSVVVASQDIPAGTVLTDSLLDTEIVLESATPDGFVSEEDAIVGLVVLTDVHEGEPILARGLRRTDR